MVEDEDANLVQSVLAGNLDDFRKLVDKYQYAAERWAFHHVQNLSDAEGIAQEAFVEAYFRLDTLREPHRFNEPSLEGGTEIMFPGIVWKNS